MGVRSSGVESLVNPSSSFWQGRRVLLTGHTGFKGGWLALWLHSLGAKVTGLALAPDTTPSFFDLVAKDAVEQSVIADIRDLNAVVACVKSARPSIVLHMAAQALVRPSYIDPVGTYATNVMGSVHIMEAVRQVGGVDAFINVTSDKCYENREWNKAYSEDDAMGGWDPYSSSKGCAELVTAAYRRSYFNPDDPNVTTFVASARAGNVVGGGDWSADRIVPDCIRAFLKGDKVQIRNPRATRPWQHVLEPLSGYLILAEQLCTQKGAVAEGWNFGPDERDVCPVSQIVDTLVQCWGDGAAWELIGTPQPHEAQALKIDATKANDRLRWTPRLNVDETLRWTVEWYKQQAAGADMKAISLDHIKRYEGHSS